MKKNTLKPSVVRPRLREARDALMQAGEVPDGLVDPWLARSWTRSRDAGLAPSGRPAGAPHASALQLERAREASRTLVDHARPVMEFQFEQTRGTDSVILLADAQGMLLDALGDASFVERAERVALRPGATWHEQWRGTNAIGTSLAEGRPLVIHGGEHYLARNGFLTCAAAPILDPAGRVLGALDISGDHREAHPHTLGLARSGARMVEHRLFETCHRQGLKLRLHPRREGLGGLTEGLLALAEDGRVTGANSVARGLLGLPARGMEGATVETLFELDMRTLLHWSRSAAGPDLPRRVHRPDGGSLWAVIEPGRGLPEPPDRPVEMVEAAPRALPAPSADPTPAQPAQDAGTLARVVEACEGNLSEAARRLGISRTTLYRRLRTQ